MSRSKNVGALVFHKHILLSSLVMVIVLLSNFSNYFNPTKIRAVIQPRLKQ